MLPSIYSNSKSQPSISTLKLLKSFRFLDIISNWLRIIVSDEKSRNLFFFLLLNSSFAFVELFYGIWTNR